MSVKRSPESLTLSDLPGVDPARFDEWKSLNRRARKSLFYGLFIWGTTFITVPVVGGGVGWLLPIVFWFTYMFAYAMPLSRAERRLAIELGVPEALGLPAQGGSSRTRRVIKIVVIVWVISSVLGLIWFVVQLMSSKSEPAAGGASAAVAAEPAAAATVVVVSHDAWQRLYGGNLDALGRTILINGTEATIIGIAPVGFKSPGNIHFWMPATATK